MTRPSDEYDARHWSREFDKAWEGRRLVDAQHCLEQWLRLEPGNPAPWSNLGVVLRVQKRFREALDCCRRALDLEPGLWHVKRNMGNVLKDLGRVDEAIEVHLDVLRSTS